MSKHSEIKICPITGDSERVRYFTLGNIPIVNNLLDTREDSVKVDSYPLNVEYYPKSGLSCLDFVIDGDVLFNHYLYKSEVNKPYYEHCKSMFSYAKKYVNVDNHTSILDIGGNDGTLLSAFKSCTDKNIHTLNIDPSKNLAETCRSKGVEVISEFFTLELTKTLKEKYDIVVCTNVFQHLKDISSFVEGIQNTLSEDGVWILEFPYWIHSMETNQFDQVYHEHIYYHSVKPLHTLMSQHGLRIVNVTFQKIHGGSLRLIIVKNESAHKTDSTVQEFLNKESLYDTKRYIEWGLQISSHIEQSKLFIEGLLAEGKTIFGFGAAAKGCVYLNAMKMTHEHIPYIIDDTDLKQGKFVPGTGIPVVNREILNQQSPDYILILAHNFSEYIIESFQNTYKGKFIVLIPQIQTL